MPMLPYLISAESGDDDLADWLTGRWDQVCALADEHGAILFRGYSVGTLDSFRDAVTAATPDLLDYVEPSTPRTEIGGKVFTSTEYPANQTIPLHNEMSYRHAWPLYLWFWCEQPASSGGATTLADSGRIAQALPDELRSRFADDGVRYCRTFNTGLDLTWQHVFRTEAREEVEELLSAQGVEYRWLEGDILQTQQTVEGLLSHPRTGDEVWFNQATLFHPSNLGAATRAALEAAVGVDRLPRTATYGDGSPIAEEDLERIRAVGESETVRFPWHAGDVLLVDNVAVAHGRDPFEGERKVRVAMSGTMKSALSASD